MATTEQGGAGEAMCPLCDDYRGKPSSVEAHISRMTDLIHQGEVGRAHRDELQRSVEDTTEVESSDDQPVETTSEGSTESDFLAVGGAQSEDRDTEDEEPPTADEGGDTDQSDGAVDVDRDGVEDDDEGMGGIPVPVSPKVLIAGSVVLLLAVLWLRMRQEGQSDDEDEGTAQRGQQGVPAGPQGGFMGD